MKIWTVMVAAAALAWAGGAMADETLSYAKDGEIAVKGKDPLHYINVAADGSFCAACGDVKLFGADHKLVREWSLPFAAFAVAMDGKGAVYAVGVDAEAFQKAANEAMKTRKPLQYPPIQLASLGVDKDGKPAVLQTWQLDKAVKAVHSMKLAGGTLLIGESAPGRCIHKINAADGKYLGKVVCPISTCCGILDFDVDGKGNVVVANLGQHRVSVTDINGDGKSIVNWGASGDAADKFCGCCNPVSVAVLPDGKIVTSEKTITRIKVYSADGKTLLANVSAKEMGTACGALGVAVDGKGNIYAVDSQSSSVRILTPGKAEAAPAAK
jgi:hypothetical protein